jgi:hypothetical protein
MGALRPHRLAVGVHVGASVVLAAGTTWLVLVSWGNPVADAYYWRPIALLSTLVWSTFALVGALIWLRKPANSVGWILSVIGLFMLTTLFIEEYSVRGLLLEPGSLPTANGLAISGQFLWTIPIGLLPILMLVYPTGRLISRAWLAATAPTVIGIAAGVASTVLIWPHRDRAGEFLLSDEAPVDLPVVDLLMGGTFIIWMIALAAGVAALIVRWRAGDPVVRRQIKLLLFASAVLTLILVAYNVFGAPTTLVSELIISAAIVALPLAIAVAILRYRLYDIDRIISRTVSYALVVGVLALVVLAPVTLLTTFLPSDDPLVVAVSTLAAAALFNPVRRRVQALIDRRFNRSRYDAQRVIGSFTETLQEQVDPDEVVDGWVVVVTETMQPSAVAAWIRR